MDTGTVLSHTSVCSSVHYSHLKSQHLGTFKIQRLRSQASSRAKNMLLQAFVWRNTDNPHVILRARDAQSYLHQNQVCFSRAFGSDHILCVTAWGRTKYAGHRTNAREKLVVPMLQPALRRAQSSRFAEDLNCGSHQMRYRECRSFCTLVKAWFGPLVSCYILTVTKL